MTPITEFQGTYSFLSNFSEYPVHWNGHRYSTAEHAYQAAKTPIWQEKAAIRGCLTPGKAKRAGKKVTLYPEWEHVKVEVMQNIVNSKFVQCKGLTAMLIKTGDAWLIEGNNWHDNFWGDCSCEKCKDIKGLNHLGKILMNVRWVLTNEREERDNDRSRRASTRVI